MTEAHAGGPVLIVNPVAGSDCETVDVVRAVREVTNTDFTIRVTDGAGDAAEFARSAAISGADEIWVAGGDGTLREVALGVRSASGDAQPLLVPLPQGTGNDLARSLGIPRDWREAVHQLGEGRRIVALDVAEVALDGRPGISLNAIIAGNGGRVGEVLDEEGKSSWGPLAYLRSAAEVAMELRPLRLSIQVDDGPPEDLSAMNVVVANGRFAAGGILVAPGARPSDGVFELVIIQEASLAELLALVPALAAGRAPESEVWVHRQVSSVRLQTREDPPIPVSVDGENSQARVLDVTMSEVPIRIAVPGAPAPKT